MTDAGFEEVYRCGVFETCNPLQFHTDNARVYMETNRGEPDLTRLVLFNPDTKQEELVESDPQNEVDFGAAIFSEKTDELVGTVYVGDRTRTYFRDKSFEADYKQVKSKLPNLEVTIAGGTDGRSQVDDRRVGRHRAGRALHLRSRHQGADQAVPGVREAAAAVSSRA